jgi:hypothetical protein
MIDKIKHIAIQDLTGKQTSKQGEKTEAAAGGGVDISLQADYAALIEKAKQIPDEDAVAVEKARQLLLSGQLESPENIRAAAENIAKFGI